MIYNSLFDDNGNEVTDRKLIFVTAEEDGTITSTTSSRSLAVNRTGFVYVVNESVIENIDKFEVIDGELRLKDGETIDEPAKTQKQLMMEELERQMAELAAMPDEVLEGNVELEEEEATEGE